MNYLKNSLTLAAFMMPLSMLTAPLPKPADKGDKAGDIPASNSESYQMPVYVQESDFDLTGTRLIEDDPRLFSSDPEDRFHAQIKDFPKDIKEQAVMHYARSEIIMGMSAEKANEIVELYRSEVAKRSEGAYESMIALIAKDFRQARSGDESKK